MLFRSETDAPAGVFTAVAVSLASSCALDEAEELVCWGYDYGAPAGPFETIDLGYWHGCAVRADASIDCWGEDNGGDTNPP